MKESVVLDTEFICKTLDLPLPREVATYSGMDFAQYASTNYVAFIHDVDDALYLKAKHLDIETTCERSIELADLAISKGATLLVSSFQIKDYPCLIVDNIFLAAVKLLTEYKSNYNPATIAVIGSIGKTTTTRFLYTVLNSVHKTLAFLLNLNTVRKLPVAISKLSDSHISYVQEISEVPFGNALYSSKIIKPDIAIITKIASSHGHLFSLEEATRACFEIQDSVKENGIMILNADDSYQLEYSKDTSNIKTIYYGIKNPVADYRAANISKNECGISFDVVYESKKVPILLYYQAEHNVYNALATFAAAKHIGLTDKEIQNGLKACKPRGSRQNLTEIGSNTLYIDCFCAVPETMRSALNVLAGLPRKNQSSRRIAVLGDLPPRGVNTVANHCDIGKFASTLDLDILIAYGENSVHVANAAKQNQRMEIYHTADMDKFLKLLSDNIKEDDIVLFKSWANYRLEYFIDQTFGTWFLENGDLSRVFRDEVRHGDYVSILRPNSNLPNVATITKYLGEDEDIVVPDTINSAPVCGIGNRAFYEKTNLKAIQFPDTLMNIRYLSFYGCTGLKSVDLPANLRIIYKRAFESCGKLEEVKMRGKVIDIDSHAFADCVNLSKINLPPSVMRIDDTAFHNCPKLIIYGETGSYAEDYAHRVGIRFEVTGTLL